MEGNILPPWDTPDDKKKKQARKVNVFFSYFRFPNHLLLNPEGKVNWVFISE